MCKLVTLTLIVAAKEASVRVTIATAVNMIIGKQVSVHITTAEMYF